MDAIDVVELVSYHSKCLGIAFGAASCYTYVLGTHGDGDDSNIAARLFCLSIYKYFPGWLYIECPANRHA